MNRNALIGIAVGGTVMGILSAIPFVQFGNCCCCAWGWIGGALAAMTYARLGGRGISVGRGVGLGLLAGILGAIVFFIFTAGFHVTGLTDFRSNVQSFREGLDDIDVEQFISSDVSPEEREETRRNLQRIVDRAQELEPTTFVLYFTAGMTAVMLISLSFFGFLGGLIAALFVGGTLPDPANVSAQATTPIDKG